jgi:hypothetical protein
MRTRFVAAAFSFALSATSIAAPIQGMGGDKHRTDLLAAPIQKVEASPAVLETIERGSGEKSVADGLYMSGQFTYSFMGSTASITLDRINNDANNTTGTLRLALWALDYEPVRGAGITGYRLVNFSTFNPLPARNYYYDITRSAAYQRPPNGTYWVVMVLSEYNPSACPTNADGYCLEDTFVSFSQVRWGNTQPTFNYSDMWWTSTESGWGISLVQHPSNFIFATWFTYDENGNPHWYVASACELVGDYCYGTLYETTGPSFSAFFDPTRVVLRPVGTLALTFSSFGSATMRYDVKGVIRTKAITRIPF